MPSLYVAAWIMLQKGGNLVFRDQKRLFKGIRKPNRVDPNSVQEKKMLSINLEKTVMRPGIMPSRAGRKEGWHHDLR